MFQKQHQQQIMEKNITKSSSNTGIKIIGTFYKNIDQSPHQLMARSPKWHAHLQLPELEPLALTALRMPQLHQFPLHNCRKLEKHNQDKEPKCYPDKSGTWKRRTTTIKLTSKPRTREQLTMEKKGKVYHFCYLLLGVLQHR